MGKSGKLGKTRQFRDIWKRAGKIRGNFRGFLSNQGISLFGCEGMLDMNGFPIRLPVYRKNYLLGSLEKAGTSLGRLSRRINGHPEFESSNIVL